MAARRVESKKVIYAIDANAKEKIVRRCQGGSSK